MTKDHTALGVWSYYVLETGVEILDNIVHHSYSPFPFSFRCLSATTEELSLLECALAYSPRRQPCGLRGAPHWSGQVLAAVPSPWLLQSCFSKVLHRLLVGWISSPTLKKSFHFPRLFLSTFENGVLPVSSVCLSFHLCPSLCLPVCKNIHDNT